MNKNRITHKELRVGNWVDNSAINCQISPLDIVAASQCEIADVYNGLDGIKLTIDILDKICLSKEFFHDGVMIYKFKVFEYWTQKGSIWLKNDWSKYPDYQFVHQLQNLYFALTQQELEIKL